MEMSPYALVQRRVLMAAAQPARAHAPDDLILRGQSELRDTQLEEWEEVLPSPPMRSDSLSSRRNLTGSGVLSLDSLPSVAEYKGTNFSSNLGSWSRPP